MSFVRLIAPSQFLERDALTAAMSGIGMELACPPAEHTNLENTIFLASVEGMEQGDTRVLSVLVTWFDVHHRWVNADRLIRLVKGCSAARVRAFWSGLAAWKCKDHRFARLTSLYAGPRIFLSGIESEFPFRRYGEDPRFAHSALRVFQGELRSRASDVLSPELLAKRHRAYRYRVMMGPTYRADIWAAIEEDPDRSAAELARLTYSSYATAHQVKRDYKILNDSSISGA